jgi:hypothetical protein
MGTKMHTTMLAKGIPSTLLKSCCATLLFFACCAPSEAGLVISFGSLTLNGGSSGYLPVYISSDSADMVGNTQFELQITAVGSAPLNLEFGSSQAPGAGPAPNFADPTFNDTNYIFFNQSGDASNNIPLGSPIAPSPPYLTYLGTDFATTNDVIVPTSSTPMLLADVPLTTLGPPSTAQDTYSISLVSAGTSFSNLSGSSTYSFSAPTPGTVIVEAPQSPAVPEPGTFGMLLAGLTGLAWMKRRRANTPPTGGSGATLNPTACVIFLLRYCAPSPRSTRCCGRS